MGRISRVVSAGSIIQRAGKWTVRGEIEAEKDMSEKT